MGGLSDRRRSGGPAFRPRVEVLEPRVLLAANPLAPGDLVVYRVGDSTVPAGTSSATPVYLDEYTPSGALVQSISLNGNLASGLALTDSGKASSAGQISLAADGSSVDLFGYNVNIGTGGATSSPSETAGLLGANGAVQLEAFTDQANNNARSAVYDPSTGEFYTSGGSGLFESTFAAGGTPATSQIVSGSTANVQIVNGVVFYSSGSSIYSLGGEPTAATAGIPVVSDGGGPTQFFFTRLGTGSTYGTTGADTLYVADDSVSGNSGTLYKFSWNGTSWVAAGSISGPDTAKSGNQIVGVTGTVSNGTATIFFTEGNTGSATDGDIYKFTDSSSSGTISDAISAPTQIVSVLTNENFRGIVVAPDDDVGAIDGLGSTTNYAVGSPAVVIGGSASFQDLSSFDGGAIVVAGGQSGDVFSVNNQGSGAGQIGVSGNAISFGGTQIATLAGGTGTTPLTISFDSVVNAFGPAGSEYAVTGSAVQALIDQVSFSSSGSSGARTVSFQVAENGGATNQPATQAINVQPANAPSLGALGTLAINQNSGQQTIQLSGISNNGTGQALTVTASSDNPAVVPNSGIGALAVSYSSPASTGSFSFTPVAGAAGAAHITVTVADAAGSAIATETVTVVGAPINNVPAAQNVIQNVTHTFAAANGDAISISDTAVGSGSVQVALSVSNGTLTLASVTGLNFISGANGLSSITVTGSVANINAALNGLSYTPTSGYSGADTLQLVTSDLGNTPTGIAQSSQATVALTVLAPPAVLLNEIDANPPGTQDNRYEYIELRGTPGASLNNVELVVFNGIYASNPGVALLTINLSGRVLGTNGLLVIKSSIGSGFQVPAGTTVVSDPTYFTATGGLPDGTLSFYLFYTTGTFTSTTDYDKNNDGVLDSLPADNRVLDDVALLDNNADGSNDKTYGSAVVFEANATGTPDAVTRFNTNNAISSAAWYGGDLVDTGNVDSQTNYDPARASGNEPASAYITPGDVNYPHRAPTLVANNALSIDQGAAGHIGTAQLQVTDPDDTSAQLAYRIVATPTQGTLERYGVALIVGNSFTQADIDNGAISYVNTNASASSDNFIFTVSDGAGGTIGSSTFNIILTPDVVAYGMVGATYSQNFTGLPTGTLPNGTSAVALGTPGPYNLDNAQIGASGVQGWAFGSIGGSNGAAAQFFVDNGATPTGGARSYSGSASNEQALGLVSTTALQSAFGLTLVNDTNDTLTQFTLGYAGQEWRIGADNALDFSYKVGGTSVLDATGFNSVAALGFDGATIDNNAAGANPTVTDTNIAGTVTGLNWGAGQTLVIRWTQAGGTDNAEGLGITAVSFAALSSVVTVTDAGGTYTGNPFPATALVNGQASLEGVSPTLAYYVGSTATGTPSSTAPTAVGTYTVVATFPGSPDYLAASSNPVTFSIVPFAVTSFAQNSTGFAIGLNAAPNLSVLNLYSGSGSAPLGTPDMTVFNGSTPVQGSLVWDPSTLTATFVQTRGILAPGNYSVTLVSGTSAWVDNYGNPLNGGSNYTNTFTAAAPAAPILSLPDFARGPGQNVDVDDAPTGYGTALTTSLPVALSNTTGVTSVSFELDYNASYLNISNVALAAGISGTLSFTNTTPGVLLVSITGFSSTATAGAIGGTDILDITASVPAAAISTYGASALLNVVNPLVNGAVVATSDSVEKVAYFGDANGDGKLGGADASLVARNKVHLDSGFNAYPLTDPRLVADIAGTGSFTSLDASQIAQVGVHLPVANIPTIPSHGAITLAGADPTVGIPSGIAATAGQTVDVPVSILDNAAGLASADLAIDYNPAALSLTNADITLSSTLSGLGWTLVTNVMNADGIAYVSISSIRGLPAGTPQLLNLAFSVADHAPSGSTAIAIDPTQSDLGDASGDPLTLSTSSGSVVITGSPQTPGIAMGPWAVGLTTATSGVHSTAVGTTTSSTSSELVSGSNDIPAVRSANIAAPVAALPVGNSLAMGVSLAASPRPATSGGTVALSLAVAGPSDGLVSDSPGSSGLNQAAVDWLLTGSRRKSSASTQPDAVDSVLSEPLFEW